MMRFPCILLFSAVFAQGGITPVNLGFENTSGTFPAGWTAGGTISSVAGLGSTSAASLDAGESIHQDFAATTADGLSSFTTSFTLRLDGSAAVATDTSRVRIRGNNNAGDLITLRLSSAGLQTYSLSWSTSIPFAAQRGVAYTITVVAGNLDADAEMEYQLSYTDGTNTASGPIQNGWHSGANTTPANTSVGIPFETLRFESGTGNTLTVDKVKLPGLILNSDFETLPFPTAWTHSGGTISITGLSGSPTAARLPYNSSASLSQSLTAPAANFTADLSFLIAGNNEAQGFRCAFEAGGTIAVDLRTTASGVLQAKVSGVWQNLLRLADNASFAVTANQTMRLRVIGRDFGSAGASYDIAWSNPGANFLSHAATGINLFASAAATTAPLDRIRLEHDVTTGNSFTVDDVTLFDAAQTPPAANYILVPPVPPVPDKIVNISGVYPHLAMTNTHLECGVGAVVPWAGKLWVITYGPHVPNGGTDKLYEINPDLTRTTRAESVGGTPANRFIHTPSNQLNIGPYFIDSNRNVRVLRPAGASSGVTQGRFTATAAHLTDPNRLYLFTMEDGLYDVNAADLTYITRYPDVQGRGDRMLFGYHGKGAYTGQGLFAVANNGRADNQSVPTGAAGVLATWNGVTVGGNGGSYFSNNPANTDESSPNPVAAQSEYLAGWNQISKTQHCEVTGPGGIYGNPNPATDPIWSTGFDAKSVLLHVMENQQWSLWRLPKASYTHDGSHGWHTEWPRIRQLDPSDPNSIYLMHMHGLFFDFPKTFTSNNFAGLKPISSYYKMPTDYCEFFDGRIVMGRADASQFNNPLALKDQSNLWFGTMDDIKNWGAPTGHGAVWMNEAVTANQTSDPFLIEGFPQRTLHLRNLGTSPVTVEIQTSNGTPAWSALRSISVPAGTYAFESISDLTAPWIRLKTSASSNLTAFFHMSSPYPHHTPSSAISDEFAALADIRDTKSVSDGIIRVMNDATLPLEFASSRLTSSGAASTHRYHRIAGDIVLNDISNPTAENNLRSAAATSQTYQSDGGLTFTTGADAASAWIRQGSTATFRLPKTDPLYEAPFAAGWARTAREAVTERQLLNFHGTFFEYPRDVSGGVRKMRALATHGKRITDFTSWRGLFVLTGVLDDAPASDHVVKNADGSAALWLGEIDDLWRMGEPRGKGGPWKNSAVTANTASDPYLMYGYNHKELTLTATDATTITVEVDFLADNTWSIYQTFPLAAGETITHMFPADFHAHWVRVKSSATTMATAQFAYGPADTRDAFLDWAREKNIPTGSGRAAISHLDDDNDELGNLLEYLTNGNPTAFDKNPITFTHGEARIILRNLDASDAILAQLEFSSNLITWATRPTDVTPTTDQSNIPTGFTRYRITTHPEETKLFVRLRAE